MGTASSLPDRGSGWILTSTGRAFYPLDPRIEDIELEDIAHALSNICRFGGHSRQFYSVAQHSVIVSFLVEEKNALSGLLHDATEAYIGDMVRPIKYSMPSFRQAEDTLWKLIAAKFGLPAEMHPSIKHADDMALLAERRDIMEDRTGHKWSLVKAGVLPWERTIVPQCPENAKLAFLHRFEQLQWQRLNRFKGA